MRKLLRGCVLRLTSILFGLLIVILAVEISLRVFLPGEINLLLPDEVLKQRYRSDFEQVRLIPESGETIHLRFNSDGFRGPNIPIEKPPGTHRVVIHGDSETAAIAVPEELTMARRLEDRLIASSDQAWQVMNFGISGYSTGQSLLAWRQYSRHYNPNLVILNFFVPNDLSDNCRCTSGARRPYFDLDNTGELVLLPMSTWRSAGSRWLTRHTRIYGWMKDRLRRSRASVLRSVGRVRAGIYILDGEPSTDFQRAWRITEELLGQFRDEVEAAGGRFLVVIAPYSGQYDAEVWQELVETLPPEVLERFDRDFPERKLGEILERQRIPYLALLPRFRERRSNGPLSYGRGHWNPAGNDLAAEIIFDYLEESELTSTDRTGTPDEDHAGLKAGET